MNEQNQDKSSDTEAAFLRAEVKQLTRIVEGQKKQIKELKKVRSENELHAEILRLRRLCDDVITLAREGVATREEVADFIFEGLIRKDGGT